MTEPLVSIITPMHNAFDTLGDTVKSVKAQSYTNWELILVDDCSSDSTVEMASEYAQSDDRIKLIKLSTNQGAAKSRNKAIEAAQGRFIAFLDSDDMWLPEKLSKQVNFHINSNVAISHTKYEWMNANGHPLRKFISAPAEISYSTLLNYNYIGCLTAMYDTELIGEKMYMPIIEKRQDYALWLSILKLGHRAAFLNESLALYRTGRKSLSSNKLDAALYNFRLIRRVEGLSLIKSWFHFFMYAVIAIRKYSS